MNQNNSKHVAVTFIPTGEEVKIQLSLNSQQIFETMRVDVFAGALHAIGTETLLFRFLADSGDKVVRAEYPLKLDSAFELVEQTDGFETKKLMQLIIASIKLHESPTLAIRDEAVAAWALAEDELPVALVVNKVEDLPRRPRN
jgi:hypothetical protein